jgi:Protein of unknown function (DUF2274)
MAKLKLGTIEDDKPIKLTVELPAAYIVTSSGMAKLPDDSPDKQPSNRRD